MTVIMNAHYYFSACAFILLFTFIGAKGSDNENAINESHEPDNGVMYWPWGKDNNKFKCPSSFGAFPDVTDCNQFYVCVGGVSNRRRCRPSQLFDKHKKACLHFHIAVCDKGENDGTTKGPTTTTGRKVTLEDNFSCPSLIGLFMHPEDCSKYYSCTFYIPTVKTCPESELFDGVKKACKPAKDVHCGTRNRPTEATTIGETTPAITTTTPAPTTITETEADVITTTTTTNEPETTTLSTTEEPTTIEPETTTLSTTEEPTTTAKPRVTAPDTDCDEDDVDCIIDDLGEKPAWFICPEDIGSFPHPSSRKLFIFCLNWKPSVKKCGQDLVFSEELMTCVHP